MSDACREWRGEVAALALGRLQPDERARVLAHTDSCADCRAELNLLEHLSRAMTHADATRLATAEVAGKTFKVNGNPLTISSIKLAPAPEKDTKTFS